MCRRGVTQRALLASPQRPGAGSALPIGPRPSSNTFSRFATTVSGNPFPQRLRAAAGPGLRPLVQHCWVFRGVAPRLVVCVCLARKRPCFLRVPLLFGHRFRVRPKPRRRVIVGRAQARLRDSEVTSPR
eukprot:9831707-Alexandrium_andersonii.AAC.1